MLLLLAGLPKLRSHSPSFRSPGCIPVFLLEGEAMPFEETVDWSNSAVRVRREISKAVSWAEGADKPTSRALLRCGARTSPRSTVSCAASRHRE